MNGKKISVTDFGQAAEQSGIGITTNYEYDNKGNLTKETYKNGDYKSYQYDVRGNNVETKTYKKSGTAYTEELASSLAYDDFDRLTSRTDYSRAGSSKKVIYYQKYEYDSDGKMIKSFEALSKPADTGNISEHDKSLYYYDSNNRLIKVEYPEGTSDNEKDYNVLSSLYENGSSQNNNKKRKKYDIPETFPLPFGTEMISPDKKKKIIIKYGFAIIVDSKGSEIRTNIHASDLEPVFFLNNNTIVQLGVSDGYDSDVPPRYSDFRLVFYDIEKGIIYKSKIGP